MRKNVKALGALKKDLDGLAREQISKVKDPDLQAQLSKVHAEALKGNRSPAENLMKNLNKKKGDPT